MLLAAVLAILRDHLRDLAMPPPLLPIPAKRLIPHILCLTKEGACGMDLGLTGKKVIVNGGARGLGLASLRIFAAEGCDIAFFSRDLAKVGAAVADLSKYGGKVIGEAFDMTVSHEAYKDWLAGAADRLGGCDIFIHNASSSGAGATGDWQKTFDLDMMGAVGAVEVLTPALAASGDGSIIFMSSTAALETFVAPQAFNAIKAALITYGSQLAQALAAQKIRVNCVSPGPIEYPGGNWEMIKGAMPGFYDATVAAMPFGRLGAPDEVAKAIVFLASAASSYTSGTNLVIDGCYTKRVQF
jgi:3-oxoacyl-[acyl-carrier protein] reductase